MLHRIRLAMQDERRGGKLGGEVEIDETYIGGKARNMHGDRKRRALEGKGGGLAGKVESRECWNGAGRSARP